MGHTDPGLALGYHQMRCMLPCPYAARLPQCCYLVKHNPTNVLTYSTLQQGFASALAGDHRQGSGRLARPARA